jgi:hypothetical protein
MTSKWNNVKVPDYLLEKIDSISRREKRARWQVLYDSLSYYEAQKKKPAIKNELPMLEKVSWYIAKLSQAVTWYITNPDEEHYQFTIKTISEIGTRLNVDVNELLGVLETFKNIKKKTSKHRALVLKALKDTILSMILKLTDEE